MCGVTIKSWRQQLLFCFWKLRLFVEVGFCLAAAVVVDVSEKRKEKKNYREGESQSESVGEDVPQAQGVCVCVCLLHFHFFLSESADDHILLLPTSHRGWVDTSTTSSPAGADVHCLQKRDSPGLNSDSGFMVEQQETRVEQGSVTQMSRGLFDVPHESNSNTV